MNEENITLNRILIIDENAEFRKFIKGEIESLGYSVLEAENAQDGLNLAKEVVPEIIFVEYQLSDMTGIDLISNLKNHYQTRNVAMVVLTDKQKKEVYSEVISVGADGYMNKKDDIELLSLSIKDILRRHNLLEELLLSKKQSERNLRISQQRESEIERFSQIVAHDLKNPLSVIFSMCEIINDDAVSEEIKSFIKLVRKSTQRTFEIIDGIYALSGLTENAPENKLCDFSKIMKKVQHSLRNKIKESGSVINIEDSNFKIYCSETLLAQVFENLISNSIKFCEKEKPELKISIQEKSFYLQIIVEDNGPGIPISYRKRAFEAFSRNHEPNIEGMGLGLSTVMKIVEYHNGCIEIDESESLGGASFAISLYKNPKHIALLGIDTMRLDFFILCLEEFGHRISVVENNASISFNDDNIPDIIFIDLRNELEANTALIKKLKLKYESLKIISIGEADNESIQAVISAGSDEFLMLPYTKETIQNRVDMVYDEIF